jgi:hypothetical protein
MSNGLTEIQETFFDSTNFLTLKGPRYSTNEFCLMALYVIAGKWNHPYFSGCFFPHEIKLIIKLAFLKDYKKISETFESIPGLTQKLDVSAKNR